jgi:hypothetical protein
VKAYGKEDILVYKMGVLLDFVIIICCADETLEEMTKN